MATQVLFPVAPFSRRGLTMMTSRFGSLARLLDYVKRKPLGEMAPVPVVVGNGPMRRETFGAAEVIGAVCRLPWQPEEYWARPRPREPGWFDKAPVPTASDLDESGVCRCGCGYEAARA